MGETSDQAALWVICFPSDTHLHLCFLLLFSSPTPLAAVAFCLSCSPPVALPFSAFLAGLLLLPWGLTDELYAQKLKYKAISEELDHALNDMTSL